MNGLTYEVVHPSSVSGALLPDKHYRLRTDELFGPLSADAPPRVRDLLALAAGVYHRPTCTPELPELCSWPRSGDSHSRSGVRSGLLVHPEHIASVSVDDAKRRSVVLRV